MFGRNIIVLCVGVLVAVAASSVWADIIDQSQEGATGWFNYSPGYWNAQSFSPTMPLLTAVEGYFYPGSNISGDFTVEIWRHNPTWDLYDDPRLGTAPLASKTINTIVTTTDNWVKWQFDTPVDISSYLGGWSLMILWKTPDIGPATPYSNADPYANGWRYWITDTDSSTLTWTQYTYHDIMFRTYGDVPEPVAMLLLGLGGLGMLRRRRSH